VTLMNNATAQVHFRLVDDELEVTAPAGFGALSDFFETEIGVSAAVLDLVTHHVRHDRTWRFTGNACHLLLDGETATIEHQHTGERTVLNRGELRTLLTDLHELLDES
jgi:hypothetical protein